MFDRAAGYARDLYHRAGDAVGDWWDDTSDSAERTARRWGNYVPHEREHHYVGQTACALGSLALGAGLVWMFDPQLGRSRRAWVGQKSGKFLRESGEFFRRTGRDIANRTRGTYYQGRKMMRGRGRSSGMGSTGENAWTNEGGSMSYSQLRRDTDERLKEKIQGRLAERFARQETGGVQVAVYQGLVTISGSCPGEFSQRIVDTICMMPEVRGIENRLHGSGESGQSSSTPTATATGAGAAPRGAH